MAYVPVQRDEGRILYQSTMDRAKLMGDTLTNLGETLYKRDEENKAFRAKNSALKQLIATHKDKFGLDEATAKQFLSGDPNKSEKENYLTLASFLEGSVTASNLKKQEDEIKSSQAQRALVFAQTANQQASAEETLLKNQAMEAARKELQSEALNLGAPIDRATRTVPPDNVSRFLDQNQLMPAGTPFDPRANQMIAGFSEKPQTVPSARPLVGDADVKKQARIAQLTEQSSTGVMKPLAVYEKQINESILKQKQDLRAEQSAQEKERREAGQMSFDEANIKVQKLNADNPNRVFTVEPGTNPNSYNIKESVKPIADSTQANLAFKAELDPAIKSLELVSSNANLARNDRPRQDRILEALKEGATTGYGSELSMKARSMLAGTGLINNKKLGRDQILYSDLAIDALQMTRELLSGQGSVSNEERKRVDLVALNIEKDPTAIYELIKIKKAATDRAVAAEDYRISLEDKIDDTPRKLIEINKLMNKWYKNNTLSSFSMSPSDKFLQEKTK